MKDSTTETVLLAVGQEDWIPLPEIQGFEEWRLCGGTPRRDEVTRVLSELLRDAKIEVGAGPPLGQIEVITSQAEALAFLRDDDAYEWHSGTVRVYYTTLEESLPLAST